MSIETWAKKVAAAVMVAPGERAPVDAVLVDHLDEFETLSRSTKLRIPAFARALTAAGLTLASGTAYDSATLRTQINRARAKSRSVDVAEQPDSPIAKQSRTVMARPGPATSLHRPRLDRQDDAPKKNPAADGLSVLTKLARSKPKRVRSLDVDGD